MSIQVRELVGIGNRHPPRYPRDDECEKSKFQGPLQSIPPIPPIHLSMCLRCWLVCHLILVCHSFYPFLSIPNTIYKTLSQWFFILNLSFKVWLGFLVILGSSSDYTLSYCITTKPHELASHYSVLVSLQKCHTDMYICMDVCFPFPPLPSLVYS